MAIDLFETRKMLEVLEQRTPPRTFLRRYFSNIITSTETHVDIDVEKNKRKMAAFVSPKMEGKVVGRNGFETKTYKPAYIKEKMVSTAAEFMKRQKGETIYSSNDGPAQRSAKLMGEDLRTLEERIVRREEWMCSQILNTGSVAMVGDGINETVDFLMSTSHKITCAGTDVFTDAACNPYDLFRQWKRIIGKDSGLSADTVILGQNVVEPFLKNAIIKERMDLLKADFGRIAPTQLEPGVTWIGFFPELGLNLYTYDEWFLEDDGTTLTPMVPVNKVWLFSSQARTNMHYGAIQDLKSNAAVARFPKSWETEDPSARWVMLQSAPLPAMHQPDGFISATVMA